MPKAPNNESQTFGSIHVEPTGSNSEIVWRIYFDRS